jgi:SAM-dependent methyltransferase
MIPFNLSIDQTVAFVERVLPGGSLRLLEVGCGRGEVVRQLRARGHEIIGVELSAEDVQLARAEGMEVYEADFLQFTEDPFDAVLFTRSLHHIAGLSEAVARARDLLKPGGLLLVEDFAVERADRRTAAWFYHVQAVLVAAEALLHDPHPGPADPLVRWERDHLHDPPLHTGEELVAAVEDRFNILLVERPCYLYRYFCGKLREDTEGCRLANEVFAIESRLVSEGSLHPVGLRLVAKKKPGS